MGDEKADSTTGDKDDEVRPVILPARKPRLSSVCEAVALHPGTIRIWYHFGPALVYRALTFITCAARDVCPQGAVEDMEDGGKGRRRRAESGGRVGRGKTEQGLNPSVETVFGSH